MSGQGPCKRVTTADHALDSLTPECKDVVIADFGIAKHYHPGEELTSLAGSPGYAGQWQGVNPTKCWADSRPSTLQLLKFCFVKDTVPRSTSGVLGEPAVSAEKRHSS